MEPKYVVSAPALPIEVAESEFNRICRYFTSLPVDPCFKLVVNVNPAGMPEIVAPVVVVVLVLDEPDSN
jgi:hypothetical protein